MRREEIIMKKITGILVFAALFLIVLPSVLALDTKINVKTLPGHRISIIVRAAGELPTLQSFHQDTGTGEFSVTTSSSKTSLDILTIVTKDGVKIVNEKFESITAGKPVYLLLKPGEVKLLDSFEEKKNETSAANQTQETKSSVNESASASENSTSQNQQTVLETQIKENNQSLMTGSVIGSGKAIIFSKITYYILGGLFLASAIVFAIFVARKKIKAKRTNYAPFKVTPLSEKNLKTKDIAYDKKISDVERKIEDAKRELDEIKNRKGRLEEARKRFEESKKELERLEKG
jgi:preprotein translocase subunit SecG